MRFLKFIFLAVIFSTAVSAHALILSDVRSINSALTLGDPVNFLFNLANNGYNPLTDSITSIKISFDFREIVETEEDLTNVDDMSNWEFIIFYSHIFDGRDIYADIDTGILSFATGWTKTNACQYTDYNEDYDEVCVENLDVDGTMYSSFVPYTDNLWLGDARLDAEVTRTSLPEPASILLFGLGLIGMGMRQRLIKK